VLFRPERSYLQRMVFLTLTCSRLRHGEFHALSSHSMKLMLLTEAAFRSHEHSSTSGRNLRLSMNCIVSGLARGLSHSSYHICYLWSATRLFGVGRCCRDRLLPRDVMKFILLFSLKPVYTGFHVTSWCSPGFCLMGMGSVIWITVVLECFLCI
jgi:hypothetical protein